MSCSDKYNRGEQRDCETPVVGCESDEGASRNGSTTTATSPHFCIDQKVLVDPKQLFIGSKIGEGAHGKVYQGRYGDRIVAIKVLNHGNNSEERTALEGRFAREVTMMSRVKHENLVKFIGACKDPLMVLVTELLPGMSLRKYLVSIRPKQLDLHVALNYALDIARAMDCLHANGIIHRDLKPDNLLLTANQQSVKLADFGLAREESVTEMMTAETGTYRWMAPELYSTVTLRQGEKKHYNNKQERPSIPEDISPDLAFIMQSCWVEDPNLRPSFSQIIRMLNEFLFALPPPEPSLQEARSNEATVTSNGSIAELSARARGKFAFLRQLFAAKKARNSQ
ncbi:serine/threonine-protein kinase STY13 isoform X3 [Coffea eugenioides]|uniref:serine/threonine-protein kinase STY13 isoform X3 n=1 Tax=Coffea eugenioides TaxID=49369 RepID=UPI000F60EABB|nr:serine/threonine-protein kinase STY13 isoform X3 [Coffea eugenioides]